MLTKNKLVDLGADKLATIVLNIYQSNHIFQKQFDLVLYSMSADQDQNFLFVLKSVKSLVTLQQPRSSDRSAKVAQKINHIRSMIMDSVFPINQQRAAECMLVLLNIQAKMNPAVDKNKTRTLCIKNMNLVFHTAWKDFLKIYEVAPQPLSVLIDVLYQQCLYPNFLLVPDLIVLCQNILNQDGFFALQERLKALKFYKHREYYNDPWRTPKVNARNALQRVADLQNDPVLYEVTTMYFDEYVNYYNTLEMAARYIKHHNGADALRILDSYRCDRYGENLVQELELRKNAHQYIGETVKAEEIYKVLLAAQKDLAKN